MTPNQIHERLVDSFSAVDGLLGNIPDAYRHWPTVTGLMDEIAKDLKREVVGPLAYRLYTLHTAQVLEGAIQTVQTAFYSDDEKEIRSVLVLVRCALFGLRSTLESCFLTEVHTHE